MKNFSIIVAISENNAIGKNNTMPWHISEDFKYFKRLTLGHNVIMGKNTWLSLPVKPLTGRRNIVISRTLNINIENVIVVSSVENAIDICKYDSENFIIGGREIYEQLLPFAYKLYITKVHTVIPDADVFFPEIDKTHFNLISQSKTHIDNKNGIPYTFEIYERHIDDYI